MASYPTTSATPFNANLDLPPGYIPGLYSNVQPNYSPPNYPPPARPSNMFQQQQASGFTAPRHPHSHSQFGNPVVHGIGMQTSMNQWLPSGNTLSGAPAFQMPILPFANAASLFDEDPYTDSNF